MTDSLKVTVMGIEVLFVEEDSDALRSSYLSLIYDLGETKINKKRVIDILEICPGFSFWSMSLLVEKCNFATSPQINNIIKLMAFKNWLSSDWVRRKEINVHSRASRIIEEKKRRRERKEKGKRKRRRERKEKGKKKGKERKEEERQNG